jgi:hypothetical protein
LFLGSWTPTNRHEGGHACSIYFDRGLLGGILGGRRRQGGKQWPFFTGFSAGLCCSEHCMLLQCPLGARGAQGGLSLHSDGADRRKRGAVFVGRRLCTMGRLCRYVTWLGWASGHRAPCQSPCALGPRSAAPSTRALLGRRACASWASFIRGTRATITSKRCVCTHVPLTVACGRRIPMHKQAQTCARALVKWRHPPD